MFNLIYRFFFTIGSIGLLRIVNGIPTFFSRLRISNEKFRPTSRYYRFTTVKGYNRTIIFNKLQSLEGHRHHDIYEIVASRTSYVFI